MQLSHIWDIYRPYPISHFMFDCVFVERQLYMSVCVCVVYFSAASRIRFNCMRLHSIYLCLILNALSIFWVCVWARAFVRTLKCEICLVTILGSHSFVINLMCVCFCSAPRAHSLMRLQAISACPTYRTEWER